MTRERRTAAPLTKETAAPTVTTPTTEVDHQSTFHAALMSAVTGRLAAVVAVELRDPDTDERSIRIRPFMTLRAAERAVLAAWDRGHRAEVVVAHMTAVKVGDQL